MRKIKAALVVAIATLFGMACGVPQAAGHHVDGDCYGFVVFDTPFVTDQGTFGVGPHEWPEGVSSLSGTQNNGTEQSSVSKPENCVVVTTTTIKETTTSTSTTTTTLATTTTSTVPDGTTTSTSPSTTSVPPQTTSSAPPVTGPPSSSTTSPTPSTVPPRPSAPSTSAAPHLPETR